MPSDTRSSPYLLQRRICERGHEREWPRDLYCQLLKVMGGKERIRHCPDWMGLDLRTDAAARIAALNAKNQPLCAQNSFGRSAPAGVRRLIAQARAFGRAVAVATTTSQGNLDALIAAAFRTAGAAWFSAIVTGEDVSRKTPDPAAYLQVLDQLGLTARRHYLLMSAS